MVVILKGYPRLSETFIAQEILELERAGFSIDIVSLRHPTDTHKHPVHGEIIAPVSYLPEYLHLEPIRVLQGLATSLIQQGFWKAFAIFCQDFFRDFTLNRVRRFGQALVLSREFRDKADLFYVHFLHTPASVARYSSLILGIPFAVSAHAKDIWTIPNWEIHEKLQDAEWCVTCTASGHKQLQSLSTEAGKVNLVYHGIDLERFPKPGPSKSRYSKDASNPKHPVKLLTVGRAVHKKGIDTLIKALSLLPSNLHWQWVHIGGGPLKQRLEALAEQLGINDRCQFLGSQPQEFVLEAYRDSDLFVLPCRIDKSGDRDGLPNVIVEAQSQGLPVVASSISAIPELLEDGVNGLLVNPDDPTELAKKIEHLVTEPARRRKMGLVGEEKVRKHFGHLRTIGNIVSFIEGSLGLAKKQ